MANAGAIERRRKIRQMETKRDALMMRIQKDRQSLAEVRAGLRQMRRTR